MGGDPLLGDDRRAERELAAEDGRGDALGELVDLTGAGAAEQLEARTGAPRGALVPPVSRRRLSSPFLIRMRDDDEINDDVLRTLERELDLEGSRPEI